MVRLAQRAVLAAAGMLAIISGVGGADLLGQAHADEPDCVANMTDPCLQHEDLPNPDPPPRSHIRVTCQPGGSKWGAFCVQRWVP